MVWKPRELCLVLSVNTSRLKNIMKKHLRISKENGDRKSEGTCYGNLGNVFCSLGEYVKAKEYYEKALAISMEIGDRAGEGTMVWKPGKCVSFSR